MPWIRNGAECFVAVFERGIQMKLYAVVGEEHHGYGIITMTADKKKAKQLAKILNVNVEEYEDGEYDKIFNHEEEIICATYFRYPGIDERFDWIEDMASAANKAADSYNKWIEERFGL